MMALAPIGVRSTGRASDEQPSIMKLAAMMTATATRSLRLKSTIARMALDFHWPPNSTTRIVPFKAIPHVLV
jgi:hypothetical protein